MQELYFILAVVLTAVAFYRYYVSIEANITESNLVSWTLWTLIGFVYMINVLYFPEDRKNVDIVEKVQVIIMFVGPLSILVSLYKKGKAKWGDVSSFEKKCIWAALFLLISIIYLKHFPINILYIKELLSIAIIILDFVVFLPLLKSIIKNPETEDYTPWITWGIGSIFALLAVKEPSFAASSFLVYISIVTLLVGGYIYLRIKLFKTAVWYPAVFFLIFLKNIDKYNNNYYK